MRTHTTLLFFYFDLMINNLQKGKEMLSRHIKVGDEFKLIIDTDYQDTLEIGDVTIEFSDMEQPDMFQPLSGNIVKIDDIFIKTVRFNEPGEYIIKIITGEIRAYERVRVFLFSKNEEHNAVLNNSLLLNDMLSQYNEDMTEIKRQLKILQARI